MISILNFLNLITFELQTIRLFLLKKSIKIWLDNCKNKLVTNKLYTILHH